MDKPELTRTETEVLFLYAEGYTGLEAAAEMGWTSGSTFWSYLADIKKKFGARTNPHVITLAYETGILLVRKKETASH